MSRNVRRNHQEIRSRQSAFRTLFATRPTDLAQLLHARVSFSRLLRRFLAEQENMLSRYADQGLHRSARDRLRDLLCHYSAYVRAWSPAAIEADWAGYIKAAYIIDEMLSAFIAWEEQELLPLLDRRSAA